jgi:hypothetical protein
MVKKSGGGQNHTPNRKGFRIALIFTLMLVFLLGCEYTAMPTLIPTLYSPQTSPQISTATVPSISDIFLPSGSKIVIRSLTQISLPDQPVVITLQYGEILVKSRLPDGSWFTVVNPNGYMARVTGSIMVVTYDPVTYLFTVNCIIGLCQIGPDENRLTDVRGGEKGWLDLAGNFQGPAVYDIDLLRLIYGDDNLTEESGTIPTYTTTPTEIFTGTPTASLEATITQTPTPNWMATATAACIVFHSKHPGTPCPH